jgi:predicted O-methyltransferase YrrM
MITNNEYIDKLLAENQFTDKSGKIIKIEETSINSLKAGVINQLISSKKLKHALEVGCAYGISSAIICQAIKENGTGVNYIIDPFQQEQWDNEGLRNLEQAGLTNYELIQEKSEYALPDLAKSNLFIDFAFIDGWHTFDHTLIDFFYVNKILQVGGVVVFDDCNWTSIEKLIHYVNNYPCYKLIYPDITKKKSLMRTFLSRLARVVPSKYSNLIFSAFVIEDKSQIKSSIVAFEKTGLDTRSYDWFVNF